VGAEVRITVVKRLFHQDLVAKCCTSEWESCQRFQEGQSFVVGKDVAMPEGFCSWAWADIQKYVMVLCRDANFEGVKPGTFVTCCTDGFRPVVFKLERI